MLFRSHGLVEIQVVLGQVGENAHRVVDTVHPIQRQSVGGCLHHHMGAAGGAHPGKQLLELQGLRCGTLSGHHLVADQILVGADQAHLGPQLLFQDGLEQIGGGGIFEGISKYFKKQGKMPSENVLKEVLKELLESKSLKRGMRFSSHYLEDPSLRKLQWNLLIKKVDSQCSGTE